MIKFLSAAIMLTFVSTDAYSNFNFIKDLSLKPIPQELLRSEVSKSIFKDEGWPETVKVGKKDLKLDYSFNKKLETYIKKELRRYGSDFASVVVIDNDTGKILSAVDYTRATRRYGKNISFSSTNPAASIFKVITAAELVENARVTSESTFTYNGKSTTLYKYQLKDKKNKWTRKVSLEKAFARSNNVVFGKAAIKNTTMQNLSSMANKFGFNKNLMQLLEVGNSKLFYDDDEYGLAEMASGFNRETLISPLHGAMIASVFANDGVLRLPSIFTNIQDVKMNRSVWQPKYFVQRVLSKEASDEMKMMMEATVKRGTARGPFRPHKTRRIRNIVVGGKTGTITGGLPYGKRDWFVSYAMPSNGESRGISVSVMIVNVKKWYIKSTALAKNVIEYYYSKALKK